MKSTLVPMVSILVLPVASLTKSNDNERVTFLTSTVSPVAGAETKVNDVPTTRKDGPGGWPTPLIDTIRMDAFGAAAIKVNTEVVSSPLKIFELNAWKSVPEPTNPVPA